MNKTILITILLTIVLLPAWCGLWLKISHWFENKYNLSSFPFYISGCLILPALSALFLIIKYIN